MVLGMDFRTAVGRATRFFTISSCGFFGGREGYTLFSTVFRPSSQTRTSRDGFGDCGCGRMGVRILEITRYTETFRNSGGSVARGSKSAYSDDTAFMVGYTGFYRIDQHHNHNGSTSQSAATKYSAKNGSD